MINNERLNEFYSVTVGAIDIDELVDINSVVVNRQLPKEVRILQYIGEIKNPYYFRIGNNAVRMQFSSSGLTLQNALAKTAYK